MIIDECKKSSIKYREYIIIDNIEVEVRTEMFRSAYKDSHFIGTFNVGYVKFETENDIDYKKKEFELYKEVNGIPIKIGKYIVTDVEDNDSEETVKVTAYDYGLKFANDYVSDLDYESGTVTLFQVLQECCTKCGVELENTSIENGNFIVDSNQFEDVLYGDVVSAVAYMSCNFATINEEGKLKLLLKTETNEVIEDYVELLDKRDTQPITSVSLGNSQIEGENVVMKDEDLIAQYGEHWLIINDCPFAYTQEKREELITAIFNKIKGFGYSAFESKYAFMPYRKLGDLVKFKNKNGDLIQTIVLKIESNYEDITLSAPSVTKATIEYQNPKTALDVAKNTQIKVDKANQIIESVVLETHDIKNNIANQEEQIIELGTRVTQTNENIELSISKLNNSVENVETQIENGVGKVKNNLVTIDINGINIATNTSKISTLIKNDAFIVKDNYGTYLAYIGYDEEAGRSKAEMDNLTVTNYFTAGYHRTEKFEPNGEQRTGVFFIGGGY